MSEIFPQRILTRAVHAWRQGEDARQTGPFTLLNVGPQTLCEYVQDVELRYEVNQHSYIDELTEFTPVYVWRFSDDPAVTDLQATLAAGTRHFDSRTKRWRPFSLAAKVDLPGHGAGRVFVIEERLWTRLIGVYDVLALEFCGAPGTVRVPVGGCSACSGDIRTVTLKLVAGKGVLGDPAPLHIPPTDPADYVPMPGWDDALGDPLQARLASPLALYFASDGALLIGCGGYAQSFPGHSYQVPTSGTLRRLAGGVISTIAGVGDPASYGLDYFSFGSGHTPPITGPALSCFIRRVSGIIDDPLTGEIHFMGTGLAGSGSGIGNWGVVNNELENDACAIVIITADLLTLHNSLGTLVLPGDPAAQVVFWPHVLQVDDAGRSWVFGVAATAVTDDNPFLPEPAGVTVPWPYSMHDGDLVRNATNTARYAAGIDAVLFVDPFAHDGDIALSQGPFSRVDDLTNTQAASKLWYYSLRESETGFGGLCDVFKRYKIDTPGQLWLDQERYLYIAATGNHQILQYDLVTDTLTLVWGRPDGAPGFALDGWTLADPFFASICAASGPQGVCVNSAGDVVFADTGNSVVRRIDQHTGKVLTIAGVNPVDGVGHGGWHQVDALLNPIDGTAFVLGAATQTQLDAPVRVIPTRNCGVIWSEAGNHRVVYLGCPGDFGPAPYPRPGA